MISFSLFPASTDNTKYQIPLDTCKPRTYSGTETQVKKALLLCVSKAFSKVKEMSYFTDGRRGAEKLRGWGGVLNHTVWKSQCNAYPAAAPHAAGASGLGLRGNVLVALVFIPQKFPMISGYIGAFIQAQDRRKTPTDTWFPPQTPKISPKHVFCHTYL